MEETKNCNHHGRGLIMIFLIIAMTVIGSLSILRERLVRNDSEKFTVSSEGKISAKPDVANISFSVVTDTQKDVQTAVQNGAEKMNEVMAAIKKLGVDEKDIKTTAYNLNPSYEYVKSDPIIKVDDKEYQRPNDNSGKSIIVGYTLNQSIDVKIKNLEKIGEIIKEAAAKGANQSGGIGFTIDDQDKIKTEARTLAIKKAEDKAAKIASDSGLKIGKLVNVSEYGNEPYFRNDFAYASAKTMDSAPSAAIPDIQSGQMEVIVNVTLTYEVK